MPTIEVLRVRVVPATQTVTAEVADNMNEEQIGQVLATTALAWAQKSGGTPRGAIERALRVLLDNPDALVERSPLILPARTS